MKVRHGVLLQDIDDFSSVCPVKVANQSASGAGQNGEPWKGALKFNTAPGEANLIELR